jgi:sarcosine oxidase, subunit beta
VPDACGTTTLARREYLIAMEQTVSHLIIGGGVIGASIAWHLTARGERDILIVDAAPEPGMGSTGRATGGYRGQFANDINVRLSLLSRAKLQRFSEDTGVDPSYRPVGYLFLADTEAELAAFRDARAIQRAAGLHDAAELSVDEAARINPHVQLDGVIGAAWCPSDGTIRPLKILRGYLDAALRNGARVRWNTRVSRMDRGARGAITHVHLDGDRIAVGTVINAAGAWAAGIAALADVALTIWARDAFHLRVRDGRALLNWPINIPRDDPFSLEVDQPLVRQVWAHALERVPAMRESALDAAAHWVGLYEMSPDKTVMLGRAPGVPNLILANGSSGHGVMHSPILGQLVAELVCDGRTSTLDITPLRMERFADGEALPVSGML